MPFIYQYSRRKASSTQEGLYHICLSPSGVDPILWRFLEGRNKLKMQKKYTGFNLEAKVDFEGQGIDTYEASRPSIIYQYSKRKASST